MLAPTDEGGQATVQRGGEERYVITVCLRMGADKERYEKELRSLESYSEKLRKPKKCLSAYMIFVKETRPIIVEQNHEMGALQVMQEVGKQWQALTKEHKRYFKEKADRDKVRYLKEQKAFYDEVEKIGNTVGTCTTKEG